jgi:glucose 1-dehydrogenase
MKIELKGRRALVTGGNSGIGEATVLALAAAGARVAINYHASSEEATVLVQRIEKEGGEAVALPGDVSAPGDVAGMFERVDSIWGGIDILVNNAGIDGKRALAWEGEPADWMRVLETNLFGAYLCAREALRRMIRAGSGVVVNLSSVHEKIPWSGYSAYTASKAAIAMLTRTLAQEAGPFNVRVVAVAPGAIETPINRDVWSDPKQRADLLKKIPLNRIGDRDDVARLIVFLASDAASYVTGTSVFIDGGMTDYPGFAHGG